MRVISVQQPWAQLIADRRRHVLIKDWPAKPGEQFAIHASHVRDTYLSKQFGYDVASVPTNAILAIVEIRKCIDKGLARPSKFDVAGKATKRKYAIAVRTIEKLRKPVPMIQPRPLRPTWECDWQAIGKASARLQDSQDN